MRNFVRSAVIGAIIASVPVSASVAAVRPGAAVPTASAATVAAQDTVYQDRRGPNFAAAWPIAIFAVVMGGLVLLEVLDDDEQDRPLTRA